ncbi:adenosine deaminase [Glaciecola sp. SC05]|uniref:adenosine deaminase n=1 Tax=Glaciecola sp. SC05 TaxID=1987355 RepID=UPI003529BB91
MTTLRLPLVDLHRHLDGNVRVSTILALAKEHKLPLPSEHLDTLEKIIYIQDKTSNLLEFLQKLDYGVSVLANIEACERIAFENVEDAYNEGLAYVELRFSPFYMAQCHKLALTDVVGAVVRGINAATAIYPVKAKLIGILSRTFGEEACMLELHALLAHHESIAGLDLAGDEYNFPGKRFVEHFALARAKTDWRYTIHAGEADGASSVWDAIHLLRANRIGHGVRAVEDPALVEYLKEHEIGIESCLTSNYQTGTWTDVASHPLKSFLEHGVLACLNTDDPGVSNISLRDEFDIAQTVLKLSSLECDTLQKNAINMAFLSAEEKSMLLS